MTLNLLESVSAARLRAAVTPVIDSAGPTGNVSDPVITACLQLGWSMSRLLRSHPERMTDLSVVPATLPGRGGLDGQELARIDLGRAATSVRLISSTLQWTTAETAVLAPLQALLTGTPGGSATPAMRAEVLTAFQLATCDAHALLFVALSQAAAPYVKAYNLGRALADSTRPHQENADLTATFATYRIAQFQADLADLATRLPAHSAKAVMLSLEAWRAALSTALGGSAAADGTTVGKLVDRLPRQGEIWRVLLTGEKDALDMLAIDDYVDAAKHAIANGRRLAAKTLISNPVMATVFLIGSSLILTAVLAGVAYSDAGHNGKLTGALVAVGGWLASITAAVRPRLRAAWRVVEKPLWGASLDLVVAVAATLPPVVGQAVTGRLGAVTRNRVAPDNIAPGQAGTP